LQACLQDPKAQPDQQDPLDLLVSKAQPVSKDLKAQPGQQERQERPVPQVHQDLMERSQD
tara:strand:- start:142 stop:321 length:180 start_codon:yes stop_codon:yes gene_type:complete